MVSLLVISCFEQFELYESTAPEYVEDDVKWIGDHGVTLISAYRRKFIARRSIRERALS